MKKDASLSESYLLGHHKNSIEIIDANMKDTTYDLVSNKMTPKHHRTKLTNKLSPHAQDVKLTQKPLNTYSMNAQPSLHSERK